ncbi:MAG: glutaredoxin family protein [Deltaproteobacteria bacterium]|nr:glutaredoxin family protein [Deltaproteobacteria bacterium]
MNKYWHLLILIPILASVLSAACNSKTEKTVQKAEPSQSDKPTAPLVKKGASGLLFSWFEEKEAKTATDISDIPDNVKKEVRVQDLSVPPEKRNPDWIFLSNLTKADSDGKYPVRVVRRDKYEEKRHPKQPPVSGSDSDGVIGAASVIMYATPHCPHCKRARRWLLEQKIPYKEINIEQNEAAAAALAQKGQAQGVPTGGVPMFEISGRLIPGFDPASIQKALTLPPDKAQQKTPVLPSLPSPPPAQGSPSPPPASPSTITI